MQSTVIGRRKEHAIIISPAFNDKRSQLMDEIKKKVVEKWDYINEHK